MKIKYFINLVLLVLLFGACQKEEDDSNNSTSPNNIVANSPLANLIARTSQNPTAVDDVLDNSSLIKMQLPVTVTVNGNIITVATSADYQLVQDAKDAYSNDNDIVYCVYPITIQFKNYTTQVINTYNQLYDAIQACGIDDGFDEIDCIAINYPISMNIYDSNNQVANTITIQSNSQLFNFIATLSNGIIAAIVYPISVTNSNGQNVVINSNTELETFIDNSIDACGGGGSSTSTFSSIITSGTWQVSYFYDHHDETSYYNGYNFTFINNGTINVMKNTVNSNGSWLTYVDNAQNKMDLSFADNDLGHLHDDWQIVEYTTTIIHLKHISGGNGDTHYLYFTKN